MLIFTVQLKQHTMYVARKSDNIQSDIKRNWSSWNFGQEGFEGTKEELNELLDTITDENPVWISGFEIWPHDKSSYEFGELYTNYWVAIDRVNAGEGLSCIDLDAETLEDAITEAEKRTDYWGDGQSFDANEAKLVYSNNDIHIFKIED